MHMRKRHYNIDKHTHMKARKQLTYLSRMDFPTFISRTSPFSILGGLGGIIHFFPILK